MRTFLLALLLAAAPAIAFHNTPPPAELPDMLTTATVNAGGKEKQNDLAAGIEDQPFITDK